MNGAGAEPDRIEFGELVRRLRRRIGTIISLTVVLSLLTVIAVFQITPLYTATASVLIDSRKSRVVDIDEVLGGLGADSETVQSEIQVLRSRELILKVARKLDLFADPEFNSALQPPSLLSRLNPVVHLPEAWQAAILGPAPASETDPEQAAERLAAEVVERVQEALSIIAEGQSRVLRVSVRTTRPRRSTEIANTLADLYLLEQLEAKFEATKRASDWLGKRVEELRVQTEASEEAVEIYRRQAGLIEGTDATIAGQQISQVNGQLILSRAQTAEASARLSQARTLLRTPAGVESAGEVLASPLIQSLREQEAALQRRAAEMSREFGAKHPKLIAVKTEVADLAAKIRSEMSKIITGLQNELSVAQVRERTLARDLNRLTDEVGQLNNASIELRALEREATANRTLLDTFLTRLKETGQQEDIQQPDARVISRAGLPLTPSHPRRLLLIVAGSLLAFVIAVALAQLLEQLDAGFRSAEQVENALGARTIALVPLLSALKRLGAPPEKYVLAHPTSSLAESLRTLHTSLALANMGTSPKVVLITSSLPEEGKSTIAMSYARLMAQGGKRVVLLDADLRRPRLASALGLADKPGMVEALTSGSSDVSAFLQQDPESPLQVLVAGERAPNPPEMLGSDAMARILASLRDSHDLVVIDSAPVLVVSDVLPLVRLVDNTVFTIRWGQTRREVAALAFRQLRDAGSSVAGVVLSAVDVRKNALYGYGDSGYYRYSNARRYYGD